MSIFGFMPETFRGMRVPAPDGQGVPGFGGWTRSEGVTRSWFQRGPAHGFGERGTGNIAGCSVS